METVSTTCEECEGKGFEASVLEYRLGDRNISEVLEMCRSTRRSRSSPAGDAKTPAAAKLLAQLADVGLGYLRIGSRSRRSRAGSVNA